MDWIFLLIIVALLLFMLLKCHPAPCESDRIVHLIDELREHEGATVEIACDNPEPETRQDQACVFINDDWTDWEARRFDGETVLDCLQKAKFQRDCSQTIETIMKSQGKERVCIAIESPGVGGKLVNRLNKLPPDKIMWTFQFLIGTAGMVGYGYTEPHRDQEKARWTLAEVERAIARTERRQL